MIATLNQENFLTIWRNKSRLIGFVTEKMKITVKSVRQADNDSDILIVETALTISNIQENSTVIVGEDIDLFVTLTVQTTTKGNFSPQTRKRKMGQRIYSSRSFEGIHKENILFFQAFSDCEGR
ncbi:hypothetical protein AVEN_253062-1 [Araneus ventricosus]|uniref:Uncharacterized protein n=1 Tax=Araneus ventricosus TaxID=182803 RepID=A0A4Y2MG88_ARAVE|nr:hypothetical protein AVEN_253062-1 [Araneus ventricosus]